MTPSLMVKVHYEVYKCQPFAENKGSHFEVESEGSRSQNSAQEKRIISGISAWMRPKQVKVQKL